MSTRAAWLAACASLVALIFLCLAWEIFLAPLKPGGSWLALKALPKLLPADRGQRAVMLDLVRRVVTARGALPEESRRRLDEIETLFDVGEAARPARRRQAHDRGRMEDEDAA